MSSPTPAPAKGSLAVVALSAFVVVIVVAVSAALVVVDPGGWPGLIGLVGLCLGARVIYVVYEVPRRA